jgi:methionyl-tRNA synthetase
MIISKYDPAALGAAFGIDMSSVDGLGVGAGWGRVAPQVSSTPHQHDEVETFAIVAGSGVLVVDGRRVPVAAGTIAQFEPFETHVVENTGDVDLVFATFYWRDLIRAQGDAGRSDRRRFGERPVFVFSTPPTPNGDLHLGHLSGPYLGADAYVRFQRMNGVRAWHLTGSDDYQSYVIGRARREGRSPAEVAAHYGDAIAETLRLMDIVPDQFTVTNGAKGYAEGLRDFFSRLVASGRVAVTEGPALFDGKSGDYLYEVDVSGRCPSCDSPAGGNICEECGEPNLCADLVAPVSGISEEPPRTGAIGRWSLPLHEFRDDLVEHHRLGRLPMRLRELTGRVLGRGRFDVPVSHPADWGIAPREQEVDGQVVWVWPEMSYGFLYHIQALGERAGEAWQAAEPDPEWKIVHFFGYDNSFYHAILYPALYRLAYPDWRPDIDYHVNEFYLLDDRKFSTSRRHAVWGRDILAEDTVDAVRFYLSLTRPEGRRTNFRLDEYRRTVDETLVQGWQAWLDDLGSRVAQRYDGRVPDAGNWRPEHTAFLNRLGVRLSMVSAALGADGFSLNQAARELAGIVDDAREFGRLESAGAGLAEWRDDVRTAIALELAAALLLARCAAPVMPRFAARLATALGTPDLTRWPDTVELVASGTGVDLTGRIVFQAEPGDRS